VEAALTKQLWLTTRAVELVEFTMIPQV